MITIANNCKNTTNILTILSKVNVLGLTTVASYLVLSYGVLSDHILVQ